MKRFLLYKVGSSYVRISDIFFFVGLINLNIKVIAATIPFLVFAFFIFKNHIGQKLPKVCPE